jgi:hypothetical protein
MLAVGCPQEGKEMKRFKIAFLMLSLGMFMGTSSVLVDVAPVEARTCANLCNQILRACLSVAKTARKAGRTVCEDQRSACRAACVANAKTCPAKCQAASDACVAPCAGNAECEAACAETLKKCLDVCANCVPKCNTDRTTCMAAAGSKRQTAKGTCDTARKECPKTCVDPVDPNCLRGCKAEARICRGDAKKGDRGCRKSCMKGTDRRDCIRACQKDLNAGLQGCANHEILCLAGCAGVPQ